jgi:hypothetical protein
MSSDLIRKGGGLASIAAGLLLVVGHVVNLGGHPEYGRVLGEILVLTAHLSLVFALVALYAAQAEQSGLLGALGMILSVVGTIIVCGVVLVEVAGASGVNVAGVLEAGVSGATSFVGGLAFLIGLIVLGIATMRAGVFPRWGGLLLIVGDVVFGAGSFAGAAASIVSVVGAAITCAGFVWLGLRLWSTRQPMRVR